MIHIFRLLLVFIFQTVIVYSSFGKQDSIKSNYLGVEIGYLTYASIDDIFSVLRYSASAPKYSINDLIIRNKKIRKIGLTYSYVERRPETIDAPNVYMISGLDKDSKFYWNADQGLRVVNTYIFNFYSDWYIKTPFHICTDDKLFLGYCGKLDFILRDGFSNIELISFTINPGFVYSTHIINWFTISFENNFTLVGLSMRKSYAGAEAQLTDNYDIRYFYNYTKDRLQFDFFNNYFQIISQASIEKIILNRIKINFSYQFNYINLNKPRRLNSLNTNFSFGIAFKLK
jgi:hypothetical protein